MSFTETALDMGHKIVLHCDRSRCGSSAAVTMNTREQCNKFLYDLGWRLYRGKQLCGHHAEQVRKRLSSKAEASNAK